MLTLADVTPASAPTKAEQLQSSTTTAFTFNFRVAGSQHGRFHFRLSRYNLTLSNHELPKKAFSIKELFFQDVAVRVQKRPPSIRTVTLDAHTLLLRYEGLIKSPRVLFKN